MHGGVAAVLLDPVLGCVIHTTLPARRGYAAPGVNLGFLRPVTATDGVLTAVGQVLHGGEQAATAEV